MLIVEYELYLRGGFRFNVRPWFVMFLARWEKQGVLWEGARWRWVFIMIATDHVSDRDKVKRMTSTMRSIAEPCSRFDRESVGYTGVRIQSTFPIEKLRDGKVEDCCPGLNSSIPSIE